MPRSLANMHASTPLNAFTLSQERLLNSGVEASDRDLRGTWCVLIPTAVILMSHRGFHESYELKGWWKPLPLCIVFPSHTTSRGLLHRLWSSSMPPHTIKQSRCRAPGGGMGNPFLTLIHFHWRRVNAPIPKNIHLKTADYDGSSLCLLSWVLLHDGHHPGAFQVLQT